MSRRTKVEIQEDAVRLLTLMVDDSETNAHKYDEGVTNGRTVRHWVKQMGWHEWEASKFKTTIALIRTSDDFDDFVRQFWKNGRSYYGISRNPADDQGYTMKRVALAKTHVLHANILATKCIAKHGADQVPDLIEVRAILSVATKMLDEYGSTK